MGTNKRYADQIDARHNERSAEISSRAPSSPFERPPIRIAEATWVLMRGHPSEPAALVTTERNMGYRRETFYLAVTWATDPSKQELIGFYPTLADADNAVTSDPR